MKKAISIFLCMIFLVQFCSCSDNKISDSADETTSQVIEFTEIEKKFNNLEPKPDYFLAVSSDSDLTDMFFTSFLEKSYEFEVNKQTADKILKDKVAEITVKPTIVEQNRAFRLRSPRIDDAIGKADVHAVGGMVGYLQRHAAIASELAILEFHESLHLRPNQ